MNQKRTGSVVHLFTYNGERVNQYVPSLPFDEIMGAYAIRPYPDGRKGGGFFVRRRSGMGIAWRGWTSFICWEDENCRCLGVDVFI